MPISFRRVDWQYTSQEDFIFESNDRYRDRTGEDMTNEQIEWMQLIYEDYADQYGDIDWTKSMDNDPWYLYMSEVLGLDDETIERYSED
jgi:hypothetical protein